MERDRVGEEHDTSMSGARLIVCHCRRTRGGRSRTEVWQTPCGDSFQDRLNEYFGRGQTCSYMSHNRHDLTCGSTLFVDGASGCMHVEHQVTLNAVDSTAAKENFERDMLHMGVSVESYHTDNGIFKSRAFVDHIKSNAQAIRCSGVGAKWQNGVSEGAISTVASSARTAMIHAALLWPEADDESLWPFSVSHAVHLYNHTPNQESGIAPIELLSRPIFIPTPVNVLTTRRR